MSHIKPLPILLYLFLALLLCFPTTVHGQKKSTFNPAEQNTVHERDYVHYPSHEWEFDTSITYSTGDFGTPTDTDTLYWPFSATRLFKEGSLGLTVPFLYQDSGPGVASRGGRAVQISRSLLGTDSDNSGLGDILLTGRYYILKETEEAFNLTGFGQIKFPTADEDEGLGTGKFDETVGLQGSKSLNDLWNLYVDLYYTFIGDPGFADLDNEFAYDAGFGYELSEVTEAFLLYAERTALVDGRDNPQEIILGLAHDLEENINVYGNVGFGVSDGSPDVSATTGISYLY